MRKTFPDMSGFSVQNLKSIRYWYKFYNSEENGLQHVSQMVFRILADKAELIASGNLSLLTGSVFYSAIFSAGVCVNNKTELPYEAGIISIFSVGVPHEVIAGEDGLYLFAKFMPALCLTYVLARYHALFTH